jgi:hypothetical protein
MRHLLAGLPLGLHLMYSLDRANFIMDDTVAILENLKLFKALPREEQVNDFNNVP